MISGSKINSGRSVFFIVIALVAIPVYLSLAFLSVNHDNPDSQPPAVLSTSADSSVYENVQGMTISCQSWGWEWGTDEMVETMGELKDLGVNWIAIHPYASIKANGSVTARYINSDVDNDNDKPQDLSWLTRPIAEAHKLGMKIMIKPHMAYWGSSFRWRGDIVFTEEQEWERFFADYERWIVRTAQICKDADAFVIATELDKTNHREQNWRQIIKSVRNIYKGTLTYASNWDKYQNVKFWDDLDVIGIQAYFPLLDMPEMLQHLVTDTPQPHYRRDNRLDDLSTEDMPPVPPADSFDSAWLRILAEIRTFSMQYGNKPVIFTELGYNRSTLAPYQPWDARTGGPQAEDIQTLCLTSALQAIENEPVVAGAFLWKWFPGNGAWGDFAMATPAMRSVIQDNWQEDLPVLNSDSARDK